MKQMRSRFRLITLLLVCAFLLTLALCTGNALKSAGITLPSLSSLPGINVSASPDPSGSPDASVSPDMTPALDSASTPPEALPSESILPETGTTPVPEYNVFGL